MGSVGSAMYLLGALFWILTIPLTGVIGLLFCNRVCDIGDYVRINHERNR